jgi:phosphate:Na+ symporter
MSTIAALLSGLGLFFIGVRMLSANLVPLVGRRTRAIYAWALGGAVGSAISGALAGLVTQSTNAVAWIIVGFVRVGVLRPGPALVAPSWANVGTALLPLLVAIDTAAAAGVVIGLVGIATYFKLARTDRLRHMLEAALGAAFLLFGMHIVSNTVGPARDALLQEGTLASSIKGYLRLLLDGQPSQAEIAAAMLLEDATGNAVELHETLAELAAAVPASAGHLVEALHALMTVVAGHAEGLGTEDPAFHARPVRP